MMPAQGRGSGGVGTDSSNPLPNPGTARSDLAINIIVNGNVVIADGSPVPGPVAIQRICGPDVVRVAFTDSKGFFSFPLIQTLPAIQDASESGHDTYTSKTVMTPTVTGFNTLPSGPQLAAPAPGICELRGFLPGFRSSSVLVVSNNSGNTDVGTIVLLKAEQVGPTVSSTSLSVPKHAKKAYEKAAVAIQKRKLAEAQAELEEAVKEYPQYAAAWTNLGWLHQQQNQTDEARQAFQRAREADDKFVPPMIGLASLALSQQNWSEVIDFTARAMKLDGVDFPVTFYYNAVAHAHLGEVADAEKSARMAVQLDTRHVLPQARLLLSRILASQKKYTDAAEELRGYLKLYGKAPDAEPVRASLAELEKLAASPETNAASLNVPAGSPAPKVETADVAARWDVEQLAAVSLPAVLAMPQKWAPPDIDDYVPPVTPGVRCPMRAVVRGISARAKELMDNLQQFSATERVEHVSIDKSGNTGHPLSATFTYVAAIRSSHGGIETEEYRDGKTSADFPANLATTGTVTHALLFHPSVIEDLNITCEGLGLVGDQPAWQLHFAQRKNGPLHFNREYRTRKGLFPVQLKGRAWVDPETYHVLRMETDLLEPVGEIALQKDHMVIDYRPIDFPKRKVQLWLPQITDLYLDFQGQKSHRRHSLTDFELFWVDVAEKPHPPEVH